MENLYPKTVAQNILKFRKEAGLSQFALAIEAGIDPKTLHAEDPLSKLDSLICLLSQKCE